MLIKKINFTIIILVFAFNSAFSQDIIFSSKSTNFNDYKEAEDNGESYRIVKAIDNYEFYIYNDEYSNNYFLKNKKKDYDKEIKVICGDARDYGKNAEWRMVNEEPFALIISYKCYSIDFSEDGGFIGNKKGEFIIVQGLSGFDFYNAIEFTDDIETALVNARAFADAEYKKIKGL